MRMVCNSTFLLDHETDHGSKADELLTLLDEWLEDRPPRLVVFSQVAGHARVDRPPAWPADPGAMCCFTAVLRVNTAVHWSSVSTPIPIAASS